jgi:hypothetical protein
MKTKILPLALLGMLMLGGCVEETRVVYREPGAPPPLIIEERGYAPYHGAEWVPGHWAWRHHKWEWIRGHWRHAHYY